MKRNRNLFLFLLLIPAWFTGCKPVADEGEALSEIQQKVNEYIEVTLTSDLVSNLSDRQKALLPLLFDASEEMDRIFWKEAYGDKEELMSRITDPAEIRFININYGPWERLNNNQPFIEGMSGKPAGANFYPEDMTKEEFEQMEAEDKTSLYTLIRRDEKGSLITVPYHKAFNEHIEKAAELIGKAAELADDPGFKNYLILRAEALLSDDYLPSDFAWMDMKNNAIDFVVGPIENYEDGLFGYIPNQSTDHVCLGIGLWTQRPGPRSGWIRLSRARTIGADVDCR